MLWICIIDAVVSLICWLAAGWTGFFFSSIIHFWRWVEVNLWSRPLPLKYCHSELSEVYIQSFNDFVLSKNGQSCLWRKQASTLKWCWKAGKRQDDAPTSMLQLSVGTNYINISVLYPLLSLVWWIQHSLSEKQLLPQCPVISGYLFLGNADLPEYLSMLQFPHGEKRQPEELWVYKTWFSSSWERAVHSAAHDHSSLF